MREGGRKGVRTVREGRCDRMWREGLKCWLGRE